MGWLRSIFAAQETAARLRKERDFYRDQVEPLKKQLTKAETRLFTEIESNRTREDAYKAEIAAAVSPQMRLPLRAEIDVANANTEIETLDDDAQDPTIEQLVEIRAKEFIEQAAASGFPYDEGRILLLKNELRNNPEMLTN